MKVGLDTDDITNSEAFTLKIADNTSDNLSNQKFSKCHKEGFQEKCKTLEIVQSFGTP